MMFYIEETWPLWPKGIIMRKQGPCDHSVLYQENSTLVATRYNIEETMPLWPQCFILRKYYPYDYQILYRGNKALVTTTF